MFAKLHVWIVCLSRYETISLSEALRVLGWSPIDNPQYLGPLCKFLGTPILDVPFPWTDRLG